MKYPIIIRQPKQEDVINKIKVKWFKQSRCILTLIVFGPPLSGISDAALRVIRLEPQKEAGILSIDK